MMQKVQLIWMPIILCAAVGFLLVFLRVEEANEKLIVEKIK